MPPLPSPNPLPPPRRPELFRCPELLRRPCLRTNSKTKKTKKTQIKSKKSKARGSPVCGAWFFEAKRGNGAWGAGPTKKKEKRKNERKNHRQVGRRFFFAHLRVWIFLTGELCASKIVLSVLAAGDVRKKTSRGWRSSTPRSACTAR